MARRANPSERDHAHNFISVPANRADGDSVLRAAGFGWEWHQTWIDERSSWHTDLGINLDNLRLYEHPKEKLSHYAKRNVDIEYRFGFQNNEWGELEASQMYGLRSDEPPEASGKSWEYFDQQTGERYIPYVIEPSAVV